MTALLTISSVSLEFLKVPIGGASSSMPVDVAIIPHGQEEPTSSDWHAAEWDSGQARLLVGPGGAVTLADGLYEVWVRVTATPEIPVMRSGLLKVT